MGIWAEIKHALNKTIGTSAFKSLDELITDHGVQTFTSDGTFTVPNGVNKILVTACGGGGAGYSGTGGSSGGGAPGAGGAGGDFVYKKAYYVTPNQTISITVGTGATSSGEAGGNTIVGNLVTLVGGAGGTGVGAYSTGAAGGTAIGNGGNGGRSGGTDTGGAGIQGEPGDSSSEVNFRGGNISGFGSSGGGGGASLGGL